MRKFRAIVEFSISEDSVVLPSGERTNEAFAAYIKVVLRDWDDVAVRVEELEVHPKLKDLPDHGENCSCPMHRPGFRLLNPQGE